MDRDPEGSADEVRAAEPREDEALATLGGGCFWCLEAVYQELEGVRSVRSGYAGGEVANPTYGLVCSGGTGHAEVVQIRYDPGVTSYEEILKVFFTIHDPTTLNRQGADRGPQYRSIILTRSPEQEATARRVMEEVEASGAFDDPVVTEVKSLDRFWPAEPEHDDYYRRNRSQGYCRVVIDPKLETFRRVFREKRKAPDPVG